MEKFKVKWLQMQTTTIKCKTFKVLAIYYKKKNNSKKTMNYNHWLNLRQGQYSGTFAASNLLSRTRKCAGRLTSAKGSNKWPSKEAFPMNISANKGNPFKQILKQSSPALKFATLMKTSKSNVMTKNTILVANCK